MLFLRITNRIKNIFKRLQKSNIKAVHDSDLQDVLTSLGVFEKVSNGNATCTFCNTNVNLDNLEAVYKERGSIKFICSKDDCVSKL